VAAPRPRNRLRGLAIRPALKYFQLNEVAFSDTMSHAPLLCFVMPHIANL
jgi:hypothetical protein